MAKNARPRNPRVLAMEVIKMMSSNVAAMKARWSFVPSTRFHMTEDGKFIHVTRERKDIPALEYRENDPEEWVRLAQFMDVVAGQAEAVARFARVQEAEAKKRLA